MRSIAILIGTLLLSMAAQAAPESFYMSISGIKGESLEKAYFGWIPVTSFSEGFMTSGRPGGGSSGRAVGRVVCQALQVIKQLDSSSPEITAAVATGHNYSEIDLVAVTAGSETSVEFLRFALHNAVISSVTLGGDSSTSARVETVSMSAQKIDVTYWPQNPDGSRGGAIMTTVDCGNVN